MSPEPSLIVEEPSEDSNLSLAERMRAARDSRERNTTEDFPVPGWASFTWVCLRVLTHKEQRKQVEKNSRVRDRAALDLYVAADTLMAATAGFYEVHPGEGDADETLVPVQTSWLELAKGVYDLGTDVKPRQAFIRLVGSERVVPFYGQYMEWLNGEREDIAAEQRADFGPTTSR